MSYILDALRKADAEREQGDVPGLHAQPVASPEDDATPGGVNQKLLWAVALLTALLLLAVTWMIWGRSAREPERPLVPEDLARQSAPPAPPPPMPLQAAQATPMAPVTPPPAPLVAQPTAPVALPGGASPEAPQVALPRTYPPAQPQMPTPAPNAARPAAQAVASGSNTGVTPPSTTATRPAQAEAPRLYTLQDLPESVRRELPNLTIGGAMYSETPAQRMLIINSQVLHEGDKLSADLTLEEIKLKSAVFRFRTYRYLVSY